MQFPRFIYKEGARDSGIIVKNQSEYDKKIADGFDNHWNAEINAAVKKAKEPIKQKQNRKAK